jgi:hypothetical protein
LAGGGNPVERLVTLALPMQRGVPDKAFGDADHLLA